MSTADRSAECGAAAHCSGDVAWPARFISALLGPPRSRKTPVNGQLRYRACAKCANSIGPLNLVVNTFLMILKGYLGVVGRSTALVADAIHSGADVISAAMLLLGLRVARRPANEHYPYGYGKIEFLVAIAIYGSLISAGVVIFIDAIDTIVHREAVEPSTTAVLGALISIIVNELMFRQSVCAGSQLNSPSLVANAWEKRSDALSSFAVFLGIFGAKLGWSFLDPAAAILVAFYILKFSLEMLYEAVKGLLDTALDPEVVEGIRRSAEQVEGVLGIDAIRSREIGQKIWLDLEVQVDGDSLIGDVAKVKQAVVRAVAEGVGRPASIAVYLKPAAC